MCPTRSYLCSESQTFCPSCSASTRFLYAILSDPSQSLLIYLLLVPPSPTSHLTALCSHCHFDTHVLNIPKMTLKRQCSTTLHVHALFYCSGHIFLPFCCSMISSFQDIYIFCHFSIGENFALPDCVSVCHSRLPSFSVGKKCLLRNRQED